MGRRGSLATRADTIAGLKRRSARSDLPTCYLFGSVPSTDSICRSHAQLTVAAYSCSGLLHAACSWRWRQRKSCCRPHELPRQKRTKRAAAQVDQAGLSISSSPASISSWYGRVHSADHLLHDLLSPPATAPRTGRPTPGLGWPRRSWSGGCRPPHRPGS